MPPGEGLTSMPSKIKATIDKSNDNSHWQRIIISMSQIHIEGILFSQLDNTKEILKNISLSLEVWKL